MMCACFVRVACDSLFSVSCVLEKHNINARAQGTLYRTNRPSVNRSDDPLDTGWAPTLPSELPGNLMIVVSDLF